MLEEDGRLSMVNALWVNTSSDYEMREQFKEVADKIYKTALHEADFERSGDEAIERINQWIASVTAQRITRLASRKNVLPTSSTEPFCLLLNVISFKCKWAQVFDPTATRDEQFTLLDGSRIEVPMMHHFSGTYSYLEEPDFRVVELPYSGNQLHAAVFLPTTIGGLADFEKSVTSDNVSSWLSRLSQWPKGVDLSLPRFTLSYRLDAVRTLQSMGLKAAFCRQHPSQDLFYGILKNKASNSKDFPEPRLFIKDVISQTWLQMSEVGSEAAATVMYESRYPVGTTKERLKPKVFRADHPFMFIIYHKPTKCILFMGRVTNPVAPAR